MFEFLFGRKKKAPEPEAVPAVEETPAEQSETAAEAVTEPAAEAEAPAAENAAEPAVEETAEAPADEEEQAVDDIAGMLEAMQEAADGGQMTAGLEEPAEQAEAESEEPAEQTPAAADEEEAPQSFAFETPGSQPYFPLPDDADLTAAGLGLAAVQHAAADEEDDPEEPGAKKNGGKKSDGKKAAKKSKEKKEAKKNRKSLYDWKPEKKKKAELPEPSAKRTVTIGELTIGEGLPKICIPVTGRDAEELLREAALAAAAGPDLVEWRADGFAALGDPEKAGEALEQLKAALPGIPLLFTCRSREEGGAGTDDPEAYTELLRWAAGREEIDLIDIEALNPDLDAERLTGELRMAGKAVVASAHFFDRTPKKSQMREVLDKLERSGADLLKLAVMPQRASDVLRLMEVTLEKNEESAVPLITMAMGNMGRISRVSGALTGSAVTFGTAGMASAPGQLPAVSLREMLQSL